jgi:O-antigen/teichoic acid export membrane protein
MIRSFRAALAGFSRSEAPLQRVFRNAGWLLASKFLAAPLSLLSLALVTRSLGPKGFGEFTLIVGLGQAVASLVAFQSWRVLLRFATGPYLLGDHRHVSRLVWFCILMDIAAAIAGCFIAVLLISLLARHYGWSGGTARHAAVFAFVLLLTVRSTAVGALRLHDKFRDGAAAASATPVIRLAGAILAVLIGTGVNGFLLAWAAAEAGTTAAYWFFVWKQARPALGGQPLKRILAVPSEHPGFWRFALFSNVNSTMASASQQIALLAVGYVGGATAAGFFRLAFQLGQALLALAEMLSRSLYAEMASDARGGMRALLARTNKAALMGGAAVILVVIILGKPALYLIGGAPYLPAYPLLVLLGSAAAVQLIGVSFEPALMALNRTGLLLQIRAVAVLCLVALLFLLLPDFGAIGAAMAMLWDAVAATSLLGLAVKRFAAKLSRAD